MTSTYLTKVRDMVVARGKVYISYKCALWDQAELESAYGMKTKVEPTGLTHPRFGATYTLKEIK